MTGRGSDPTELRVVPTVERVWVSRDNSVHQNSMPYKNSSDKVANVRKWINNNRDRHLHTLRGSQRKYKYGITNEKYSQMVDSQGGKCAICDQPTKLCVDHDHTTGKVRELLCNSCNAVLGYSKENQIILRSAIKYLNKHGR